MGTYRPKRTVEERQEEEEKYQTFLEDMENAVKDAITEGTDDHILSILIDVVSTSIVENRLLYLNPLDEPVHYRLFCKWVREGLEEALAIEKAQHPQEGEPPPSPS